LKELPRPVLIQSERRKPKGKNIHSRRRKPSPGSSFKSHTKNQSPNPKNSPGEKTKTAAMREGVSFWRPSPYAFKIW
jgi:hypothetical protein